MPNAAAMTSLASIQQVFNREGSRIETNVATFAAKFHSGRRTLSNAKGRNPAEFHPQDEAGQDREINPLAQHLFLYLISSSS